MDLCIKKSKINGQGSFTPVPIKKGWFIKNMLGIPYGWSEVIVKIKTGIMHPDDPLQVEDDLFLDLDLPSKLINHSCHPNAGIRKKNELFALRDIRAGEEITYDYSTTVSVENNWQMLCNCRNINCRKVINTIISIPVEIRQFYITEKALPDFILKQVQFT